MAGYVSARDSKRGREREIQLNWISINCVSFCIDCAKQSLFFLGPSSKWTRAWLKARNKRGTTKESLSLFFSQLPAALVSFVSSTLARTCTPITKSGEKERLLAVLRSVWCLAYTAYLLVVYGRRQGYSIAIWRQNGQMRSPVVFCKPKVSVVWSVTVGFVVPNFLSQCLGKRLVSHLRNDL